MVSLGKHTAGEYPHRGITMHQMPVGGSFPGILFAVGSALIFLFAIPALWYVVGAAAVAGLLIAAGLQVLHRDHLEQAAKPILRL